jgi:glycosyltransferase involved in cell wall biosynthesis
MSKISIALCTYNGAKFLSEQLESFLSQTRPPDELVIGDDCSTDETAKIIEDFAQTAPFPVRLQVNQKNLGSTKNFERTISRCAGDLIFLSDQDDLWAPEKISRVEREFAADAALALIFSDAELVDESLQPLGKTLWDFTFPPPKQKDARDGKLFAVLLDQNVITGATMAFRSRLRDTFMPIPENVPNLIHDGWIALAVAARAEIKFIDEPLIKYRQHSSQQLGINFHSRQKKNYEERKKQFADSIRFFQNEGERLSLLKKILDEFPAFENRRETVLIERLVAEKEALVRHYKARQALPLDRLNRVFPVTKEVLSGRYRRFSRGWLSAAKDLLEKW